MMLAYNPHINMAVRMTFYATLAGPLLMLAFGSVSFFSGTDSAGLEDVLRFTLEVSFAILILGFVFGLKIGCAFGFRNLAVLSQGPALRTRQAGCWIC